MAGNEILFCVGFLRGAPMSLADFIPSWKIEPPLFSQPHIMWMPLHGSGALNWGPWLDVETPHFSGGPFEAELSLWSLSCHLWEWGQAFLHLHPSY